MEEFLSLLGLSPEYVKLVSNSIGFFVNLFKCFFVLSVLYFGIKILCNKIIAAVISKIESQERQRQFLTLKTIVYHTLQAINFTLFAVNLLLLFGIDVRPIIATAGVLGVAVGFGSKKLVEDIITGIMIILEGQIRVGDYVNIEGIEGFVEKVTLPLITVRSFNTGAVNFIRCGYIDKIINHTYSYSYAFFALDVGYEQNVDHVVETLKKSFAILKQNVELNKLIYDDIEIFGLDEFKESSLCIKCRIKTLPKGQWAIKRAFNKIIKEQFEIENIEIPYNQIVVSKK